MEQLTTLAVVLGWAVGAIGGFLSQHLLRDASRPVRLGVPGLALAAGIGLGLFLGTAMFGLGIGFAVGFTWGDSRWKAERLSRPDDRP
jgi:hypothetical protein